MTSTDAQVRIVMTERSKGRSQQQAAAKANLSSRKTVSKYERLGRLPSELKRPRAYRTREGKAVYFTLGFESGCSTPGMPGLVSA